VAEAVLFRLDRDPMASTVVVVVVNAFAVAVNAFAVVVVVVNAFAVVVQTPEGFRDDQSLD